MLIKPMREKTAAEWTSENPVLPRGLGGFELDTKKFKVGDGRTTWDKLPYLGRPAPRPLGPLKDLPD